MFYFLLIGGLLVAIVFGAGRIIIGWIVPASTAHAIDNAFNRVFKLFFQLVVVGLAGLILYLVVLATRE